MTNTPPPPHSREAEEALIGVALRFTKRVDQVLAAVRREDLFSPLSWAVYDAIEAIHARGDRVDTATVLLECQRGKGTGLVTAEFLDSLEAKGDPFGWQQHARIVRDMAALRRVIEACSEATAGAYERQDAEDVIGALASELAKIATGRSDVLTPIGDVMHTVLDRIEQRSVAAGTPTGVLTGVWEIDRVTTGFQPGQLIVIAALTGGGKTALAMQTLIRLATQQAGSSGIAFNLEMTREELAERALIHAAMVDGQDVRTGQVDIETWSQLQRHAAELAQRAIYLEDAVFGLTDIVAKARAWRTRHPNEMGLVVVDFLQLVHGNLDAREGRHRQLGVIAQTLKRLAKELRVPVVMVSQLNRAAAKSGEAPSLADLKESGDIEQAADIVILGHNREDTADGIVELNIAKHRGGPRHRCEAHWTGKHFRFSDVTPVYNHGQPEERRYADP